MLVLIGSVQASGKAEVWERSYGKSTLEMVVNKQKHGNVN